MKSPIYRYEQAGEAGVTYPTLAHAMRHAPWHAEATIRTSAEGVVLAETIQSGGVGGLLRWQVTNAGRDVEDHAGWTALAPTLSPEEYDTALAIALGEELKAAS